MNLEERMELRKRVLREKKLESLMKKYRSYRKEDNHFKAMSLAWYIASAFDIDIDREAYDYEA